MSLAHFTFNPRFPALWRDFDERVRAQEFSVPAADVVENDKAIEIHLDMPGVAPEAIDVKLEGNQLTVTAERASEKATDEKSWIRRERSTTRMSRSFTIPATLDGTKPEASYKHGVLTLTLPKREEAQPRSLKVKVAS